MFLVLWVNKHNDVLAVVLEKNQGGQANSGRRGQAESTLSAPSSGANGYARNISQCLDVSACTTGTRNWSLASSDVVCALFGFVWQPEAI